MKRKIDSPNQEKLSKDKFLKNGNAKIVFTNSPPIGNNLAELKHLEQVLDNLINSGKEQSANKYLDGFLESKNVRSLQDYLNKLK